MNTSLIISTYNRGHLLQVSLDRLTQLTLPDEILVIDDGGTDSTERICDSFKDRLPIRYIYTHNPGPSICSHARNVGVRQAHYEWLITSEPELFWLTDVVAQFKEHHKEYPKEVISSGKVWFLPEGHNPSNDVVGLQQAGDYIPPNGAKEAIGWVAPYTALWKKEWIESVGGWDEQFPGYWGWDDIDLLTRLRLTGINQYIDLEVMALHQFHGYGGDKDFVNEKYFRTKSFSQGDETQLQDLVANKNIEWGKIK